MSVGGPADGGEPGVEGLAGISVSGADLMFDGPRAGEDDGPEPVLPDDGHLNLVRFGADGSVAIRDGADVAIVVYTAA